MNYIDFVHPADAAALRQLENLPAFPMLTKKAMEYGLEMIQRINNLSYCIKLTENQMPEIYSRLVSVCGKMGMPVPELYMDTTDVLNAYTTGDTRPCIVLTEKLMNEFTGEEIEAVIAHECGHILCHHVLYSTLADFLLMGTDELVNSLGVFGTLSSTAIIPLKFAMMAWSRASELSADRAASVAASPQVLIRVMALLQYPKRIVDRMNLEQWASQAQELEQLQQGSKWNDFLQKFNRLEDSHPYNVVRAYEISKWIASDQYRKIMNHLKLLELSDRCPSCGQPVLPDWAFCKNCGTKL